MDTTSVWNRTGTGTMSANLFVATVAFWTAFGIAISAVAAYWSLTWNPSGSLWLIALLIAWALTIGAFAVAFGVAA